MEEWPADLRFKVEIQATPAEVGRAVQDVARATFRVRYKGRDEVMIGMPPGYCLLTQGGSLRPILAYTDQIDGLDLIAPCSVFRVTLDEAGKEESKEIPPAADVVYVHLEAVYREGATGRIKAERVSDYESLLTMWADAAAWPDLELSWDLLESKLHGLGLTDSSRQFVTAFEITIQGASPDGFANWLREAAPRAAPEMTAYQVFGPTEHFPDYRISVAAPMAELLREPTLFWRFEALSLGDMTRVIASCHPEDLERMAGLLTEIERVYQNKVRVLSGALAQGKAITGSRKEKWPSGRPGLEHDELVYRLAMAQEAEELRAKDSALTWKEIAREIGWRLGYQESGIKLLLDARYRLRRLQKSDPDGLLAEVAQRKEKKKT